jgi:hypothetical protein
MEVIIMDITERVALLRFNYHGALLDANNILCQLGIRSDEKGEEIGKKHAMIMINDIIPRLSKTTINKMNKKASE